MKKISILLLALFPLLLYSCIKDESQDGEIENYIRVGDKLPEFILKNTAGDEMNSQELEGKITLLVFFLTTCPDCERELPVIEETWKNLHENPDYRLVAISRAESAAAVTAYWEKNSFTMPFYLDPKRDVFSLFANSTIPRVYLVNRERVVTWMAIEEIKLNSKQLTMKVNELMNTPHTTS